MTGVGRMTGVVLSVALIGGRGACCEREQRCGGGERRRESLQ
jgi:hypothetical protein